MDLTKFTETEEFKRMKMKERMMVCTDILLVLSVMHDQGIFHCMMYCVFGIADFVGDLTPKNVAAERD